MKTGQDILPKFTFCVPQKKIIQVWNGMGKEEQNYDFWVNYPFKHYVWKTDDIFWYVIGRNQHFQHTHVVCTNLLNFGPLVCVSRPYTFWGTRAPFAIFHLLKKWMTSKGLGSQKQSCWWSSSKHPESLRSIHITENNPCIHVSHKLLPQTTTPPPTTQPYSSSPKSSVTPAGALCHWTCSTCSQTPE